MHSKEFWKEKLMIITRRQFVPLAAAGAMAAFGIAGCSNDEAATTGSTPAADTGSAEADTSSDGELTLFESGKLTFATSPDYPPFENLEDGEYVGLDMDLGRAIAEELGLDCKFTTLQFDGIVPAIAAGGQADVGISGITVDPERAEQVDFTDSYYIADQAVAVMKGGEITSDNVDDALNAEGKIIAVQSGTTGESFAQENFGNATVQPYGNATDCFAAMQSGQADAVIMDKAVVESMLASAYTDAEIVKTVATGEEYAVAVAKDNPALTKAINEAIAKLQEDGTIDDLVKQYLS